MEYLLSNLQNEPLVLGILAAIAVTLALFYLFPTLLHLVPTTVVNEKTKKTHRRSLFFGALFLVLVALGAFFVPGIGEGIGNLFNLKEAKQTKVQTEVKPVPFTINGTLSEIDESKSIIKIEGVSNSEVFVALYNQETKFLEEGKPVSKSELKKGSRISVTGDEVASKTGQFIAKEVNIVPLFPSVETGAVSQ